MVRSGISSTSLQEESVLHLVSMVVKERSLLAWASCARVPLTPSMDMILSHWCSMPGLNKIINK